MLRFWPVKALLLFALLDDLTEWLATLMLGRCLTLLVTRQLFIEHPYEGDS